VEGEAPQSLRGMWRVSNITSNHACFAIISVSHAGSNAAELCARMLIRSVCEVTMGEVTREERCCDARGMSPLEN
jgi:hypothetical protein